MDASDYVDVEGGPVVRTDWVGTSLYGKNRYTTEVVSSQEACYKELERQIAPLDTYFKTGILINFTWITLLLTFLADPAVSPILQVITCALVFCAFEFDWYFQGSEKQSVPAALKKHATKEFSILAIVVTIFTGIGLLIIWLLEKIGAFFAR
jgi:hypothetical protein